MKNIKKLASLLLALVMILSMATNVFADEVTYSITINNENSGHTYEAYQIFTGKLSGNVENDTAAGTTAVLSDIQWGSGVSAEGKTALLTKYGVDSAAALAEKLNNGNIKDFVTAVSKYLIGTPKSTNTVSEGKYVIEGLAAGYYLVKDQNGSLSGDNDSYTSYILEVVENSTLNPKSSVPQVQKKVDDKNDSDNSEDAVEWEDSADYDIGDEVPFQLKATLASNVESYLKYKVVFHDTMSAGLTYVRIDSVKIVNKEGGEITLNAGDYTVGTAKLADNTATENFVEGTALTITIEDAKGLGAKNDAIVYVEYTATLNSTALLGAPGNPNVVYLEYSNNPNWGWDVWTDKDNDGKWDKDETPGMDTPENPNNPYGDETGKTPEDKVIVFTYKLNVNKITLDENGKSVALTGAVFTLEKKLANGTWKEITLTVKDNVFSSTGLDDGIYRLTETKAPVGYNQLTDPIYFKVEATHDELANDPALNTLTVTLIDENGDEIDENGNVIADVESGDLGSFTADVTSGFIATNVVNNAGVSLPETGGMGTTLFYVFGGILVLSAVVLLVTKRRMAA